MAVEGHEGSTRKRRRPPFPEDFGERLERLLKMAELSPRELAEFLGVTEPTVWRCLRGGEPKGFNYLAIVSLARGVPGGLNLMLHGDRNRRENWLNRSERPGHIPASTTTTFLIS